MRTQLLVPIDVPETPFHINRITCSKSGSVLIVVLQLIVSHGFSQASNVSAVYPFL